MTWHKVCGKLCTLIVFVLQAARAYNAPNLTLIGTSIPVLFPIPDP